jgi:endonuclease YncB( thermonuclease family)
MLQYKSQIEVGDRGREWNMGIDRRRVATYVGLALIAGFALGYVAAKYLGSAASSIRGQEKRTASPVADDDRDGKAAASAESAPAIPGGFHTVLRTIRADTIEVDGVGVVRMLGIETPDGKAPQQIYAPYARRAVAFTEANLVGKEVRIEFDAMAAQADKDEAGRTIAYVYTRDGQLFNGEMIKQGQAFLQTNQRFRLMDEFRLLERDAMESMRGVWGPPAGQDGKTASAQPESRTGPQSQEKTKRIVPMLPSDLDIRRSAPADSTSESMVYISPSDRMYHKDGCDYLNKKKKHPVPLSSAKAEGYVACGRCFASTVLKAQ